MAKRMEHRETEDEVATEENDGSAMVTIEIPIGPVRVGGNQGKRFIDTRLELADAAIVARIADALIADGARLNNGRPVRSSDDVLAWIAQRLQGAVEPEPEKSS